MPDFAKMERDYQASVLDMSRLHAYAQKVAASLVDKRVPFDGFTDADTKSFWDEASKEGFFKTLFKEKTGLDYQHIGYWTLAATSSSRNHTDRKKTRYDGFGVMPAFSLQHEYGGRSGEKWVLLANGRLARSSFFARTTYSQTREQTTVWREMTESDILLLDHRSRTYDRFYNNRQGSGYEVRTEISSDNYLMTDKKGVGCSKALTGLLKRHGLLPDREQDRQVRRQPATAQRDDRPPITKTYTLTAAQLRDGCILTHTFANGTTARVHVRPDTRSGKVITVRTRQSGTAEAIRVLGSGA